MSCSAGENAAALSPPQSSPRPRRLKRRWIILGLCLLLTPYITWRWIDSYRTGLIVDRLVTHGNATKHVTPWHHLHSWYTTPPIRRGMRPPKPVWLDLIDRYIPEALIPKRTEIYGNFVLSQNDIDLLPWLPKVDHWYGPIIVLTLYTYEADSQAYAPLQHLTKLKSLALRCSKITDDDLRFLSNLHELQNLNLSDTTITDKGLVHLRPLTQLRWLNLDCTKITDAGLEHLQPLNHLKYLSVQETQVNPEALGKLLRQDTLNYLTGLQILTTETRSISPPARPTSSAPR